MNGDGVAAGSRPSRTVTPSPADVVLIPIKRPAFRNQQLLGRLARVNLGLDVRCARDRWCARRGPRHQHGARDAGCDRHRLRAHATDDLDGVAFAECDVRDVDAVAALVGDIVTTYGRWTSSSTNAAARVCISRRKPPALSRKFVELNLLAPLIVAQAANAVMQNAAAAARSSTSAA